MAVAQLDLSKWLYTWNDVLLVRVRPQHPRLVRIALEFRVQFTNVSARYIDDVIWIKKFPKPQ